MGDLEELDFEEIDFQVVDECADEEEPTVVTNTENNQNIGENTVIEEIKSVTKKTAMTEDNPEEMDYTADISSDQLDDRDVIDHLTEIENIVLDAEGFGLQVENMDSSKASNEKGNTTLDTSNAKINDDPDIILLEEPGTSEDVSEMAGNSLEDIADNEKTQKNPEEEAYQKKLNEKVEIVKSKLVKLSRVLITSYPAYEPWLARIAATTGSSVCKLEPARGCPLDQSHINRWKFICTRKPLEESAESMTEGDSTDATVDNKNVKTVWRLGPSEGSVVNAENAFQSYPPFVMRTAKIFEDFVNGLTPVEDAESKVSEESSKEQWLWLLIRCNSKKELLLFVTGKEVNDSTMENLKQLFDSGAGKDCLVKSLYCKSVAIVDNAAITRTTFLLGSEALDETVGGLKIQLPPKTNFPASTFGTEQLGKAVHDLLQPTDKSTIVEIGCGLGVIGLMMASKCEKVLGLDSLTEVEEAETTAELNKITNATFFTGQPNEVASIISKSTKGCKRLAAIVNANTKVGRDIEILLGLRTVPAIRRVVMITSMAKQSIRSILELLKPDAVGNPFMPSRAIVVDTLPDSPHFEVAILMERRAMNRILRKTDPPSPAKSVEICSEMSVKQNKKDTSKSNVANQKQGKKLADPKNVSGKRKNPGNKKSGIISAKPGPNVDKGPGNSVTKKFVKNPFHSGSERQQRQTNKTFPKVIPRSDKTNFENPRTKSKPNAQRSIPPKRPQKRKPEVWGNDEQHRPHSTLEKQSRINDDQSDLRTRLSGNRHETDLIQTFKQQQQFLEDAIEELKHPQLQNDPASAQSMFIEKIKAVQCQLSRSVWDRIAPAEISSSRQKKTNNPLMRGSVVQDHEKQDLVIMTPNTEFLGPRDLQPFRKYYNLRPLSPNQIMPNDTYTNIESRPINNNHRKGAYQGDKWNQNKSFDRNKWVPQAGPSRRAQSPIRRHDRSSPKRARFSPPTRYFSPPRHQMSPQRNSSLPRNPISPPRRSNSESNRNYDESGQRRPPFSMTSQIISPPKRQSSPLKRQPPALLLRNDDDWDIPSRGAVELQSDWQRQDRQLGPQNWEYKQPESFRVSSNPEPRNWDASNSRITDTWNNKNPIVQNKTSNQEPPWQIQGGENRWSGPGQAGTSSDNWNIRNKESTFNKTSNSRDDSWMENNKPRWEPPLNLPKNWNQGGDKEDWNDLPEDARDPWDDGNSGRDPWKNSQQGNWGRDKNESAEWKSSNNGSSANSKPQWQNNMGNKQLNINNPRWGNANDNVPKKTQQMGNWQLQGSGVNNSWRPNFPSAFPQPRPFNNFNDGR